MTRRCRANRSPTTSTTRCDRDFNIAASRDEAEVLGVDMYQGGAMPADHETTAAEEGGDGGHVGPQPWTAMTDPKQCAQLEDELAEEREVALSMPSRRRASPERTITGTATSACARESAG